MYIYKGETLTMGTVDLSIIIPAYNESIRIVDTLNSIKSYLADNKKRWNSSEVIVVSDGSSDDTDDVVRSHAKEFPELKLVTYSDNRGKGYAIKQGVLASVGNLVLFTDADGATPITELDHCAEFITSDNTDMVIASRRSTDANVIKKQPLFRKILGNAFSLTVRMLLGIKFLDTQCGFKLFKGDIAREIFKDSKCEGFAIDIELIHLALRKGYRIKETGVIWIDGDGSKVDPLRDGIKMLIYIGKLSMKTKAEELKIKLIDFSKEVVGCLKQFVNPKNFWIYSPPLLGVGCVYFAQAHNIKWILDKGGPENTALVLLGITISILIVAAIRFRNMASMFFLVLAINFLIREMDKTPLHLPYFGDVMLKTKSYIYVALGVMTAWGIWQEKKLFGFLSSYPLVKIMFLGLCSSYAFSQVIARRLFKHIPLLPNEEQLHIPLEEMTETTAHILFLMMALVILWYSFFRRDVNKVEECR